MNPVGTETRGEDGNWNDPAPSQAQFFRHDAHNVAIAKDVRATDVEDAARGLGHGETSHEIADDIPHGDWLARRTDPARRDHDRQAFDKVAENLEGRRPGSDNHGGAEDCNRYTGRSQSLFDFTTRGQVLAEIGASFTEAAKVDDPPDSGFPCRKCELQGQMAVLILVRGTCGVHGMNQVESRIASGQILGQGRSIFEVGLLNLKRRARGPFAVR